MADIAERLASLDFAGVSPEEFARIIKGLSNKEIQQLGSDAELRLRVGREIFGRMERQFRPEAAGSLRAVIRWKITGVTDMVVETTIADGAVTVHEGRTDIEPRVTLVMDDAAFLKLVSGNASPVTMFITRKIKVAGDLTLASGLNRYFDIPKP